MNKNNLNVSTSALGQAAESRAAKFLEQHGLIFVRKNFLCKMGEIDLIMREKNAGRDDTLVFVEVRLRTTRNYETGAESISRTKIRKLLRTAELYLTQHPETCSTEYRFDVVSLGDSGGTSIDWIKDAFTADY